MLRWRMPSPLTNRFVEAVAYANEAHKDQTRKGTPGSPRSNSQDLWIGVSRDQLLTS